jgi:hypothetical protein
VHFHIGARPMEHGCVHPVILARSITPR